MYICWHTCTRRLRTNHLYKLSTCQVVDSWFVSDLSKSIDRLLTIDTAPWSMPWRFCMLVANVNVTSIEFAGPRLELEQTQSNDPLRHRSARQVHRHHRYVSPRSIQKPAAALAPSAADQATVYPFLRGCSFPTTSPGFFFVASL